MKSQPQHNPTQTGISFKQFCRYLAICFPTPVLVGGMAIISLLITFQTWSTARSTQQALYATESTLNRNVAHGLAEKLRIFSERAPQELLNYKLEELAAINPSLRLYIINTHGIVTASPKAYGKVTIPFVDVAPVKDVLEGQSDTAVILGDDPLNPGTQVPFSVATLRIAGESHYLYVVISHGSLNSSFMEIAGKSVALTTLITAMASTFVVVSIIGLIFYRRLKTISTSLAVLSHDLRSPLTSIQGSLETLMERGTNLSDEEALHFMKVALRSATSATSILNDVHHLSKMEATGDEVTMEPLSLSDLIMDTVMAVKTQSDEKRIVISVNQPPCMPLAMGNLELLERLVRNVIDNSLRYTPPGGRIDISLTVIPGKVRVTILDNGPGISDSELNSVTRRFVRGSSGATKGKGSGIGLSVASEVARIHGGSLRILSRKDEGTVVLFEVSQAQHARTRRAA